MGDHQAGDLLFRHDALGQFQHLFGGGGVERGGVLIEQEKFRSDEGRHQQRQRLALSAGEQAHRLLHPVFQPHIQQGQLFAEQGLIFPGDAGEDGVGGRACAEIGQRQILFDGHVRGGALERVLEEVSDDPAALKFRGEGDVLPAQRDAALVGDEAARNGVEQGGFACTVRADDGGEVACFHPEADTVQGHLFIDRAGVEGLVQVVQFQHFHFRPPPSSGLRASAFQRPGGSGWPASR